MGQQCLKSGKWGERRGALMIMFVVDPRRTERRDVVVVEVVAVVVLWC